MFNEAVEADLLVQDALWELPEILLQINVILQAVKLLRYISKSLAKGPKLCCAFNSTGY